jgi:NTE family protein
VIWRHRNSPKPKIGLVLPGGGARAAYQVGVLRAVARLLPKGSPSPFQIITGTSAGSINAAALAIHADDFRGAVHRISHVWKNFEAEQVYRTDAWGITKTGFHWLAAMALGGLGKFNPHSLLDRSPLYPLLEQYIPCDRIQHAIDEGWLHALGITASSYQSGFSVTFYQAHHSVEPWSRERRIGRRAGITIDHLMASSAIPFLFKAVRLGDEYFGDGSVRQVAPLSGALHLGADRVLVVGIRKKKPSHALESRVPHYPTMAEVAGHILDSIFLDNLDTDLERLERINKTISLIPGRRLVQGGITLRPVEVLTITPSRSMDLIAARHARLLPRALRYLLRGVGALRGHGATLVSYLLFEKPYCRELISLGYHDAMQQRDAITRLLDSNR